MKKVERIGTPLKQWNITINFGIKTGFNEAFIIDENKKNELIEANPKSAEIIRPILRGRDIEKYRSKFANRWIIATFPSKKYNIDSYPAVKNHLLSYDIRKLEQSGNKYFVEGVEIKSRKKTNNKWFETQDSIGYWDDFSRQKIVWKRIGSILRFSLDETGCLALDSTCLATGNNLKYLCSILNSKMGKFLLRQSPKTGTGDYIISVQAIEPVCIPVPTEEIEGEIELLFDKMLDQAGNIQNESQNELDQIIFKIFQLDDDEIEFISNLPY